MVKLPKSFLATEEEDEFFEKAKAEVETEEAETEVETEEAETEVEEPEESADAGEEPTTESELEVSEEPTHKQVPIGELYKERQKRRELQAKVAQLETTFGKVMERLGQPAPPQPAVDQPQIPDYEVDPIAHIKARLDQLQGAANVHQQVLTQQSAIQQFSTALSDSTQQFRAVTPDYDQAVEFAKQARVTELQALGYTSQQALDILRQEILGTSAYVMQQGRNPAEAFYAYAKARGWRAPKPVESSPTAAPKLATVAKAQKAARSLPGGAAPKPSVTLEDLLRMEDEEFDKHFERIMRKT